VVEEITAGLETEHVDNAEKVAVEVMKGTYLAEHRQIFNPRCPKN
jgi:hypothetical protein